jgi:Bacterial Ig-like domain (group 2).
MQLTQDQKVTLSVDPKDLEEAKVEGFGAPQAITWTVNDGSVVSLTVSEDRLSCEVRANAPGTAVVTVTDHAASPRLVTSMAVDVLYGDAPSVELHAGDITHQ